MACGDTFNTNDFKFLMPLLLLLMSTVSFLHRLTFDTNVKIRMRSMRIHVLIYHH